MLARALPNGKYHFTATISVAAIDLAMKTSADPLRYALQPANGISD
jgi:hypothetical protein